jgi:hypothetical protein
MKHFIIISFFCLASTISFCQEVTVAKSTSGVQTGLLGLWFHYESRLAPKFALRTELGFDASIWGGSIYDQTNFLLTPVITVEPRFIYNLEKRKAMQKSIEGNAGNFFSLPVSYRPNWFVISNFDNVEVASQFSIIPTWGIKRNLGVHTTFETGIGFGFRYFFTKNLLTNANQLQPALNLHLRFGYRFN